MKNIVLKLIIVVLLVVNLSLYSQTKIGRKNVQEGIYNGKLIKYAEREIVIKLKNVSSKLDITKTFKASNIQVEKDFDRHGLAVIKIGENENIFSKIDELKNNSLVEFAEPNGIIHAAYDPNDTYYQSGLQWYLKNTGQNPPSGTSDADIDAPEAWNITQGSSDIKIAVLDSGIPKIDGDLSHPDLNDYPRIMPLVDYVGEGDYLENVKDLYGHGTHVAGIIGAETNNTEGIAGIANGCTLFIYKVFDYQGNGYETDFYYAVEHAIDWGVQIINFSGFTPGTSITTAALDDANSANVIIVAAAGNDNLNYLFSPASYCSSRNNVISVGATDQNDSWSTYSNHSNTLNVVAPGGYGLNEQSSYDGDDIYSTTPNYATTLSSSGETTQSYGYLAGTSMAAPVVSAIAALMLSKNPNLTPLQVRNTIEHTAEDKGATGYDQYYGHGRVNAYYALLAVVGPQNFHTTNGNNSYVSLAWDAIPASVLQHYEVSRNINNWGWSVITTTTNTSYTDNEFQRNRTGDDVVEYRVRSKTIDNVYSLYSNILSADGTSTYQQKRAELVKEIPTEYDLSQNYPNPFNPTTVISYALPEAGNTLITIYDYLGREVTTLVNDYKTAGKYEVVFDATRLSSGLYFYKINAGRFSVTKKMMLVK